MANHRDAFGKMLSYRHMGSGGLTMACHRTARLYMIDLLRSALQGKGFKWPPLWHGVHAAGLASGGRPSRAPEPKPNTVGGTSRSWLSHKRLCCPSHCALDVVASKGSAMAGKVPCLTWTRDQHDAWSHLGSAPSGACRACPRTSSRALMLQVSLTGS